MASLKWVKITTTITGDWKMGQLLDRPQGKRLLLAWILLICFAGELNEGGFFIKEHIPLTIKDFKNPLRETTNFLNYSFKIFINLGLLGIEENTYYIVNWDKHQNEDKLEQIRKNARLRQQAFRERHRAKQAEMSHDSNVTVTPQNQKENQNQNENILLGNQTNQICEQPATKPTPNLPCERPSPVRGDVQKGERLRHPQDGWLNCNKGIVNPTPTEPILPTTLTTPIQEYCSALSPKNQPSQTHQLLLTWLCMLKEKNRLPTVHSLPLLLEKLHPCAEQSGLSLPHYLEEVICRGWHSFYPIPRYGAPQKQKNHSQTKSYDINELEAII